MAHTADAPRRPEPRRLLESSADRRTYWARWARRTPSLNSPQLQCYQPTSLLLKPSEEADTGAVEADTGVAEADPGSFEADSGSGPVTFFYSTPAMISIWTYNCRLKQKITHLRSKKQIVFYVDCCTSPTMAEVVRRHPKVTVAKKRFRYRRAAPAEQIPLDFSQEF
ncbi:hypothetical protein J6590_022261 [Homalodisca vitripennis]|nr:hypothetical protein J6590_022261 [Homalodisca vitripennis]